MPVIGLRSAQLGPKGNAGATGAPGAAGAGAVGLWTPSENGFLAGPCDPILATGNTTVGAGIMFFSRVKMTQDSIITNLHCFPRTPAGAGLANTFMGVYTVSGGTATLLAATNDISSAVTAASDVKAALSAPTTTVTAGTTLLIAFLSGTSTTAPTLRVVAMGNGNTNLTATSPYRSGTYGTGQTSLPASFALSATSSGGSLHWFGAS